MQEEEKTPPKKSLFRNSTGPRSGCPHLFTKTTRKAISRLCFSRIFRIENKSIFYNEKAFAMHHALSTQLKMHIKKTLFLYTSLLRGLYGLICGHGETINACEQETLELPHRTQHTRTDTHRVPFGVYYAESPGSVNRTNHTLGCGRLDDTRVNTTTYSNETVTKRVLVRALWIFALALYVDMI